MNSLETILIEHRGAYIVECLSGVGTVNGEQEALALVAACMENRTQRVLLPAGTLSDDFFHLRSGVAGSVLLKLSNYRVTTAAIISAEQIGEGKFRDWVLETNRGREFRIFSERYKALDWLASINE
jgi:PadR family transcriptional regulator, regulatory protein AphA